ncbi:MAG: hypothetical protein Q7S13_04060, partial [Candidatus Omnitrophota bacterium]|nr:hypothetical protein [Candidatus Omnitrophota bacterium]
MEIRHDALMYQRLGSLIYQDGIIAFFKVDKSNVILSPLIIAFSHHLADILPFSHIKIQTFLQLLWLGLAQFLLYKILILMKIHRNIIMAVILYFGFSPAIVNSSLSSWPEILTYPLILGIVLLSYLSWDKVQTGKIKDMFVYGFSLAAVFFAISIAREVYEYVVLIYLFFYFIFLLKFIKERQFKHLIRGLILLLTIFSLYQAFVTPYKLLNYKYVGYKS